MSFEGAAQSQLTEQAFVEQYKDSVIEVNGLRVPLTAFVQMEARFCTADPEKRSDEAARIGHLARRLGEQNLEPQHHYLLGDAAGGR